MAFLLQETSDGAYFQWAASADFVQDGAITLTMWVNPLNNTTFLHGDLLFQVPNPFFAQDPIQIFFTTDHDNGGNGCGLTFQNIGGGSFPFGVNCVPGLIDPKYKWQPGFWLFFACTRNAGGVYQSYFGNRNTIVLGQTGGGTPPGFVGSAVVNMGKISNGEYVGPFSYWRRMLTLVEIESMAQCVIPADPGRDLLLFSKMNTQPPTDLSTYGRQLVDHGDPQFLADPGCANYSSGQGFRVFVD